jgi:transposase, IS30 family
MKQKRMALNQSIHCRIPPWSHLEKYIILRLTGTEDNPLRDSPDQIAGRWREERAESLSKDTIYSFIRDHHPHLIGHLRRQWKKYQKKMKTGEEKYQIQDRVMIEQRWIDHPDIWKRDEDGKRVEEIGHWEIDTVVSAKTRSHGVITAAERTSGYFLTSHTRKKTAWNICDWLRDMFEDIPRALKKTLTSDNGREFAYHKIVSYETQMDFYFANPYSPWERGTNENTNWLLRQHLPKKQSFADLTHKRLQSYTKSINSRPRRRHNYLTPEEVLFWVRYRLTDELCNLD